MGGVPFRTQRQESVRHSLAQAPTLERWSCLECFSGVNDAVISTWYLFFPFFADSHDSFFAYDEFSGVEMLGQV